MPFNHREILPKEFDAFSRVWIYQSSRLFTISEALQIEDQLRNFIISWKSHGTPVKGWSNLLYGQFIVLMADEKDFDVSGCSTDSSVHLIKNIEEKFQVQFFNRLLLAFLIKEKIQLLPLSQLEFAFSNQHITENTLYFNNTIQTKKELEENWLVPVGESWLKERLSIDRS